MSLALASGSPVIAATEISHFLFVCLSVHLSVFLLLFILHAPSTCTRTYTDCTAFFIVNKVLRQSGPPNYSTFLFYMGRYGNVVYNVQTLSNISTQHGVLVFMFDADGDILSLLLIQWKLITD